MRSMPQLLHESVEQIGGAHGNDGRHETRDEETAHFMVLPR